MDVPVSNSRRVRFGLFEADLSSQKLLRRGSPVHLQEKPFQLLALLLERAGEVVTREELRLRLWESNTFVEFDEGVNAAAGKLRYALGDAPENPTFLETVRGKGYRWIAPFEWVDDNQNTIEIAPPQPVSSKGNDPRTAAHQAIAETSVQSHFRRRGKVILIVSTATALLVAATYFAKTINEPMPRSEMKQHQLTTNSTENPVSANSISPDGKYLAYADLKGLHLKLLTTGEVRDIPNPDPYRDVYVEWGMPQNWLPDGTRFLVNTNLPYQPVSTWVVSVLGAPPRRLRDDISPWAVSSDGSIAYTASPGRVGDREIGVTNPDGLGLRKVLAGDDNSAYSILAWSPDGKQIAFIRDDDSSGIDQSIIGTVDVMTSTSKTVISGSILKGISDVPIDLRNLVWLPDGRLLYSVGVPDLNGLSCNYWQLNLDKRTGRPTGPPSQVTRWSGFCVSTAGATTNGNLLVFQKVSRHLSVLVSDFDARSSHLRAPRRLTDQQGQEYPTAWTADSEAVIFASIRSGRWEIFKQRSKEEKAELIASGLTSIADQTPLTPDGSSLLNVSRFPDSSSANYQISKIPIVGGAPEHLVSGNIFGVRCALPAAKICAFAEGTPDHKQFIFSELGLLGGKGRGLELARFNREDTSASYDWALSPDGTTIAVAKQPDRKIHLIPLGKQIPRTIEVKGWDHLQNLTWRGDGRGFFASHPSRIGNVLLDIDLQGHARILWEVAGQHVYLRAIPSPDDRHVAILSSLVDNNVWSLEDF